jgi:hypothetical protein
MISADLALALLMNRTAQYYGANAPVYMTYDEYTHVNAPTLGRTQDINRSIAVRVADNFAVMQDLPNGGQREGQAFPIVAYFDPFASFAFGYFANLKRVDITLTRGNPYSIHLPPPDPTVNVVVPYFSEYDVRYAPDSTENAPHLVLTPTSRLTGSVIYWSDIVVDPQTQLPSHIEMRELGSDQTIALDFKVIDGHWVITHGTFTATQHALFLTFKVIADVTFQNIAFPTEAPNALLAGTPSPSPVPSVGPSTPSAVSAPSPTPSGL